MTDHSSGLQPRSHDGAEGADGWHRGFWSLILTQFQVAFSDNALKNLVILLVLGIGLPAKRRDLLIPTIGALFSVPFILFSMAGGFLADRFSKRSVTIGIKVFEIAVMLLATAGLAARSLPLGLAAVFLMGTHSALFGPSKYGILPEILPSDRLSWGNGVIELGTFLAIIGGTVGGSVLSQLFRARPVWSGVVLVGLAATGLITSLGITAVPSADPAKKLRLNFVTDLAFQIRVIRGDRVLWLAVLGNTYFFFLAALLQFNIVIYGKDVLALSDSGIGGLLAAIAIGIGLGSFVAGHLSGGKIEYGLIPLGAIGLTLVGGLLALPGLSWGSFALGLAILGFSGGFFIVPISALIQRRPAEETRGGVIAASSLLSFIGIFLASAAFWLATSLATLGPGGVFLLSALLTLAATVYVVKLLPDALLRLVLWIATHTVYRIRVEGRRNIPPKGGALLVCNHLSFVDALLLIASTDRFIHFLMYEDYYDLPYVRPLARWMRVIPLSSEQRPRDLLRSLKQATEAIRTGGIVCIFPEGQITRTGQMLPFRRGFERIMKGLEAPIVPVNLDGVWGSIFSYQKGRFLWKLPRRIPYPVTISYGEPLPPTATPSEVRSAVQELNSEAWVHRKARMRTLPRSFVATARRHPWRFAMADASVPMLRYGPALARTVLLARRLRPVWKGQDRVGLLLPPSVSGAVANLAAMLMGKVPVNLNFTLPETALASCIAQCGITTVLSSRAFLERIPRSTGGTSGSSEWVPCRMVMVEDLATTPSLGERALALLLAFAMPASWLGRLLSDRTRAVSNEALEASTDSVPTERSPGPDVTATNDRGDPHTSGIAPKPSVPKDGRTSEPAASDLAARRRDVARVPPGLDDEATIIFSSGSTGDPKGVVLTHYNIAANVEQLSQTFAFGGEDRLLGALPFFHSFGFTGAFALPLTTGLGVVYHPSPLDARAIGALVRKYEVTFMVATPTFLNLYLRVCPPEDFGSVRLIMTGAEKLSERLAVAFEERFGLRPMEGYGCTECSPAVTINVPDYRAAGFRQIGSKRGKIGHPLPGVSVRIVDPESWEPRPVNEPGLLLVKGPNVMKGYLGRPDLDAEVLRDGWYVTGDIASEDEDGFLEITDRLSRFSKIGGEMVPHIKLEDTLHELAGAAEPTFAVAGVPDAKKGERLVVLHTLPDEALTPILEKLPASGLPNLWLPRADAFHHVDALPYLGTGKLDLRKIREMAMRFAVGSPAH